MAEDENNGDNEQVKKWKKWFKVLSLISGILLAIAILMISSMSSQIENYEENYQYDRCGSNEKSVCIGEDEYHETYSQDQSVEVYDFDEGERALIYNAQYGEEGVIINDDEDYTVCDTDRKEKAICVDENDDSVVSGGVFVDTCQPNENAKCVKSQQGTINDYGSIDYCKSNEYATCRSTN